MDVEITLGSICAPSDAVVSREIEGDVIIVPLTKGIGEDEDELYTLNDTGRAIWLLLDGRRTLSDVAVGLAEDFGASQPEIEADVVGFARELVSQGILATRE